MIKNFFKNHRIHKKIVPYLDIFYFFNPLIFFSSWPTICVGMYLPLFLADFSPLFITDLNYRFFCLYRYEKCFRLVYSIVLYCRDGAYLLASQINENDVAAYIRGGHSRSLCAFERKNHRGVACSVLLGNDFNVSNNDVEIRFGQFVSLCAGGVLGQELHSPPNYCERAMDELHRHRTIRPLLSRYPKNRKRGDAGARNGCVCSKQFEIYCCRFSNV